MSVSFSIAEIASLSRVQTETMIMDKGLGCEVPRAFWVGTSSSIQVRSYELILEQFNLIHNFFQKSLNFTSYNFNNFFQNLSKIRHL